MSELLLSKRYAQALFDLALEFHLEKEVKNDLDLIKETIIGSKDLKAFLRSPVAKPAIKDRVVRSIFSGKIQTLTDKFIALAIKHRRESILLFIAQQYIDIFKEHFNISTIEVTTAVPVDADLRKRMLEVLEDKTGSTIELIEKVDEKIIGGFILKTADRQYDSSLRNSLKKLKKEFEENLYVRKF